ncbi:LysR family transcriptional regulator [Cupriavidus numazuensis]|uniref:HTH-type transcriptional regulator CynR n=1 Tax=Cupriavidus numazuensis TaxID=221992 RepID=A0ABM8TMG6_9BURK|nr:LysR family transcriptional regulator [Cupriavidus numazuensis]CAG2154204.1 HTH-type transcriptional regulator CynR [Cupriavidus numazuensis]
MDIKQLRAFLAIADTGSITRASETLHLAQPALSRQLRMLEEDLGTPLFERTPRGMELTDAGSRLIERARRALREIDGARTEIVVASPGAVRGTVDLGLLTSQSELIAAPLVAALRASHPELMLRIYTGYSDRLREWLENGEVGLAMLTDYKTSSQLDMQPLFVEQLCLVGGPRSEDLGKAPIGLQCLVTLPLILPVFYRGLRLILDHASEARGIKLNVVAETNDTRVQKAMAEQGLGFAVLPMGSVASAVDSGSLKATPIAGEELQRRTGLAVSMMRRNSLAVRAVANELTALTQAMIQDGRWPGATWLGRS